MITLRSQYHDVGNKVNTALMGVSIAKRYMETLTASPDNTEVIKDSIASCAAAEKALLELDGSLQRLKSLSYRFADPDASIADLAEQARQGNAAVSILIVDDEPEICGLARRLYEKRGYAVTAATGGEEAIARIKEGKPHIVLLDLHLYGKVEGIDVLRYIKQHTLGTRCIVITGEDDSARIKDVADLGPDDILIKPVLAAQLDAKVSSLIAGLKK